MADSTTLMTFLVRVPPTTRSVSLLGSWDNFTQPYTMQRDSKRGREHWTGCHSFQNIICDGNLSSTGVHRDGGLKMGGTYWYYYKLDDYIEFHNSAEPSTATCPMLPGQLVNVLNVPFHLSNGRPRNDSVSSTSSDLRTMDPSDKYLNPRPVPHPPLPRLNTSPVIVNHPLTATSSPSSALPWSAFSPLSSRGASQPNSAATMRSFRLPRKPSMDGFSRSRSPANAVAGIKATIRQFRTPRSGSPEADLSRGRPEVTEHGVNISKPLLQGRPANSVVPRTSREGSPANSSRSRSPHVAAELEATPVSSQSLALRRGLEYPGDFEDPLSLASFQQHRRQRSRSREPSSLRRSLTLSDDNSLDEVASDASGPRYRPLETLTEALSAQNTPTWPVTARQIPDDVGTSKHVEWTPEEKRLPTLPSSPSSAYPSSAASEVPAKRLSQQIQELHSHFSASTVSRTSDALSFEQVDRSHFSAWTATTASVSIRSHRSASFLEDDSTNEYCRVPSITDFRPLEAQDMQATPVVESAMAKHANIPETLASATSCSTICSALSTSPSSPESTTFDNATTQPPHAASPKLTVPDDVQAYRLPSDEHSNLASSKEQLAFPPRESSLESSRINVRSDEPIIAPFTSDVSHSESMQLLLEELSYLGEMIQH